MSIRHFLGNLRRAGVGAAFRRNCLLGSQGPIVSFTFDDFPQSALQVGGAILEDNGVRGTFYAAMGLMGQLNSLGRQFCEEDVHTLIRNGHELGSHTFSHLSCRSSSFSDYQADVRKGKEAVEQITGSATPHHFSYPFGHATLRAKGRVGRFFASCRGIAPGINESPADLNLLRANSLYSGSFDFEAIRQLLLAAVRTDGWLIFYTHDISENPSQFGCTPREFTSVVRLARSMHTRIAPVGDAIDRASIRALPQLIATREGRRSFDA